MSWCRYLLFFFFQAEDGIRDRNVTGVQTCALPISTSIRVAAEGERIEVGIVDAAVDHVDALRARGGAHPDEAVLDEQVAAFDQLHARSEERRVGKECRCRWGRDGGKEMERSDMCT